MAKGFGKQKPQKEEYVSFLKKAFNLLMQKEEDKIKKLFESHSHLIDRELSNYLPLVHNYFLNQDYPEKWVLLRSNYLALELYEYFSGITKNSFEILIRINIINLERCDRDIFPGIWAMTQILLGDTYQRIGGNKKDNQEESIKCFQLALKVSTNKAIVIDLAVIQASLGHAYHERIAGDKKDNLENAIRYYQLALGGGTYKVNSSNWVTIQMNLGNAYFERIVGDKKDNLESAINCYKLALGGCNYKVNSLDWAMILMNLGNACSARIVGDTKDNIKNAINCYKLALEVLTPEANPTEWAKAQINLGISYCWRIEGNTKDNIENAINCYKLALEVLTPEANPIEWAKAQINLGIAYFRRIEGNAKDNIENAINCYKSALIIEHYYLNPDIQYKALINLGELFFQELRWDSAIETYDSAIKVVETMRNYANTDNRRQEIQIDALNIYDNLIQACLNTAQIEKAIEYSERFRSRMLVDLVAGKELTSAEVNDGTSQLIKEFEELQQKIDLERQYLKSNDNNLNSNRSQAFTRAQLEESSDKIRQLEQDKQIILQQIRAQDPVMAGEIQVTPLPFAEIQKLTNNPKTAILNFYSTEEDTHIFIVYGDKAPQHYICQQQGSSLSNWIEKQWLQPYQIAFSQDDERLKQQWRESIPDFLQELAHRLEINNLVTEYLSDIEELIIIPHLYLHNIPFTAIALSNSEYLGDRFRIRYAPSCQILQYCQEREPIAEIKYGTVEDADNSLPGARVEGTKIAQIRNIEAKYRLIGKDHCSVDNYRQLSKKVQVLHSSHHAVSRLDNPLESSLNLGDGNITLGELLLWRRSELVEIFLSCCETNLGITEIGDDVLTLASGFLCAGARAVISSLWKADDLAATLLSIFYHQLRQEEKSRAEALQLAQQKLRNLSGEELQDIYEREFEQIRKQLLKQIKVPRNQARKEYKKLSQNDPHYELTKAKFKLIDATQQRLGEMPKLISAKSQQPLPFSNPYYWSVFICSGMS